MRYLKLLGLVGLAVISMLLTGAATSSATVLCKTTATPCESAYGKEAVIKASMSGTAVLTNTEGPVLDTCTSGSVEATITGAGGGTSAVFGSVSTLTWSGCSATTDTLSKGEIWIEHIAGTDNGTVKARGFEVTVLQGGISCVYGAGVETDLGMIRGREKPTIEIYAVVNKVGGPFECPSDAIWRAKYELAEPLYVEGTGLAWCKTTTSSCGSPYETGATLKAGISGSAVLRNLKGSVLDTCTGGTVKGELVTDGSEPGAVSVPLESLTWSSCTSTTDTLRAGELDLTPTAGTDNAKVVYTGIEITYVIAGVSCSYGGNGGYIGRFEGGEKATIGVSTELSKSSGGFLCNTQVIWSAEYKVEEPTPLYVESS